ncbi:MAG: MarR family transcriptional regulator [Chloroflexi bacterium]|nr:MarR family transcriptional regulator [Chloroflexota bacterium]
MNSIEPPSARHVNSVGMADSVPSMTLAAQLMLVRTLLGSFIENALSAAGLNSGEADVLMAIRVLDGKPITPTDLMKQFALSSAGVTKRIDALEKKQLLYRKPHPTDRRSITLHLTQEGEKFADDVITTKAAALAGLTKTAFTPQELDQLNIFLTRLITTISSTTS